MGTIDGTLMHLATSQQGVVAFDQLTDIGLSGRQVEYRTETAQ